mgnify:CR=1 FL=1
MFSSDYILALIVSFAVSVIFTLLIAKLAKHLKIVDSPDQARKVHLKPTPLLGGLAIFLSFNLVVFLYSFFTLMLTIYYQDGSQQVLRNFHKTFDATKTNLKSLVDTVCQGRGNYYIYSPI